MNRVNGKIVVAESGAGIPDLLVSAYDVDGDLFPSAVADDSGEAWKKSIKSRLGSGLTTTDGTFALEYEDSAFQVSDHNSDRKRRPDLILTVAAPEEAGKAYDNILHVSRDVRRNAAEVETYVVRQPLARLEEIGLSIPLGKTSVTAEPQAIIKRVARAAARTAEIEVGIQQVNATRLASARELTQRVDDAFKDFHQVMSRIPPERLKALSYVPPGASVREAINRIVERDIHDSINAKKLTGQVSVTEEQLLALGLQRNEDGSLPNVDFPAGKVDQILFGSDENGPGDVVLERRSPMECLRTNGKLPEGPCETVSEHSTETAGSGSSNSSILPFAVRGDEAAYVAKLLGSVTPPEIGPALSGPENGASSRPIETAGREGVQHQVDGLQLRGGPGDVTAYYDFHNLQIAFEDVWQEAFDDGITGTAKEIYRRLVKLGVSPNINGDCPKDFCEKVRKESAVANEGNTAEPPASVVQIFSVTLEQWNVLSGEQREKLEDLAKTIQEMHNDPGREIFRGKNPHIEEGERLLGHADNKVSSGEGVAGLNQLLDDLEKRVKQEPYAFTVFAADCTGRSINFGLLVSYRQKWEPLNYQVGKLVKTIPLAPKEVRKYTTKVAVKKSRAQKEIENSLRSHKDDSSDTSRAESEIVRNAQNKTNFSMSEQGGIKAKVIDVSAKADFSTEASKSSTEVKKDFREGVLKAAEEYKTEHSLEVNTSDSTDSENEESGEISNPNDEIPVTYLFYELQRRFRVSEEIHRLTPVVLVAQRVPTPDEIDEDWLVSNDWILRRVMLDDSFLPALGYLSTGLVGDEACLNELQQTMQQQRDTVLYLREEITVIRETAGQRYEALEQSIKKRADAVAAGSGGGLLSSAVDYLVGGGGGDNKEAARIAEDAAKDAYERVAKEEKEQRSRLEREVTALNAATEAYTKALAEHLNRKAQIARLQVHIKQNILYYMQAIWSHEPPDQRFFRLHQEEVPKLQGTRTYRFTEHPKAAMLSVPHRATDVLNIHTFVHFEEALKTETLAKIADLDNPLGFKGNYMIFALREHNDLTNFMSVPYRDPQTILKDPDEAANWNLTEFAKYVCCLREKLPPQEFEAVKPRLQQEYNKLLKANTRDAEEVILPTGSLYIEALPGTHSILENFKLMHRAIDVKKVQAEVRAAELENVRAATRILVGEREDKDVEKKIIIESNGNKNVVVPTGDE